MVLAVIWREINPVVSADEEIARLTLGEAARTLRGTPTLRWAADRVQLSSAVSVPSGVSGSGAGTAKLRTAEIWRRVIFASLLILWHPVLHSAYFVPKRLSSTTGLAKRQRP